MTIKCQALLEQSPAPEKATRRLEQLLSEDIILRHLKNSTADKVLALIHIISISDFLYRFLCRQPESIAMIGVSKPPTFADIHDIQALKLAKYRELLRITWLDVAGLVSYEQVLSALSRLADNILIKVLALVSANESSKDIPICLLALGKLGAYELNYSSDVDLMFVCANDEVIDSDVETYHRTAIKCIRRLSYLLDERTADGFFYRVDLNIRPWGRSGPLVMSVDDTEHYYESSTEAWERFAWMRARIVAGCESLGNDLLGRLHPFIFRRSLSLEELDRFINLKDDMAETRLEGYWNIKTGNGGIRDIEFFIQTLQIFNAHGYPSLQKTNTMAVLDSITEIGLVTEKEANQIRESYLFLRRLENRLQMVDEQQVHHLPYDADKQAIIARSMELSSACLPGTFDNYLSTQRQVATDCFERVLLSKQGI